MHQKRISTHTNNKGDPRVGIGCNTGVSSKDEGTDDNDREDQKTDGGDVTEEGEGGELHIVLGGVVARLDGGVHDGFLSASGGVAHGCSDC